MNKRQEKSGSLTTETEPEGENTEADLTVMMFMKQRQDAAADVVDVVEVAW